jgi:broad specificity phosphatase PhoE
VSSTDAPAPRCAELLGLHPVEHDPALAERHYGTWAGRLLSEVIIENSAEVDRWLHDPHACPPGGESVAGQVTRVGRWMDTLRARGNASRNNHQIIAVTHPSVVRAVIVHALGVDLRTYWRLDCEPWSLAMLTTHNDQWNLRMITAG